MFLFDQINESESDDRISHLLYADDLALMAENENDLQTFNKLCWKLVH